MEEFDVVEETAEEYKQRVDLIADQLKALGEPLTERERLKALRYAAVA